jgi:hypothetical protein
MMYEDEAKLSYWNSKLRLLVKSAKADGVVLTISQVPTSTLAMGVYDTKVEVRLARVLEEPIKRD